MPNINQNLKCNVCGQIVGVLNPGGGELACCGSPMKLLTENTTDAAKEKHVPVITKVDGGFKVSVGSVAHPMEEKHSIQWIELQAGGITQVKHLKPGEAPEATFKAPDGPAVAREFCNLHGLWKA
ncbi:MAG: desulfoferrodoxin [Deltaproteobacteria bacterium]|jgi:superoxide reductase|nr:desulfoferrodoxin [Deltaproteobacteria bacterium]